MDLAYLLSDAFGSGRFLWSPPAFAVLVATAVFLIWLALIPARPTTSSLEQRMGGYVERERPFGDTEMQESFVSRAIFPIFRGFLRALGRLSLSRNVDATEVALLQAGQPLRMSALDYFGLRLLSALLFGVAGFFLQGTAQPMFVLLRNAAMGALVGYILPTLWLRRRVRTRKQEILRALPDALDMLTIGVEAGLAFESALIKVGEKFDNALTQEFRRAVGEMRVGVSREHALNRMTERSGVPELDSFVAVLIQSTQLGVSIAQVLHSQAAQMRMRRRQRAEELARQASVKMVFALVLCIFPAMFVVILGPAVPAIMETLRAVRP